jgi:prevent-host-death family protein
MTELLKNSDALEVSADDLRTHLANYIGQVMYADRVVLVKKHNRDAAIILSPRMFDRIVKSGSATREDRAAALKRLDAILSKVPTNLAPEETQAAVNQAVKEVRAQKRKKKS